MGLLRVRDKETGVERTVTEKAYSIIPHRYTVLGRVDDAGNDQPYSAPAAAPQQQKKSEVAAAADIPQFTNDEVVEHPHPDLKVASETEKPAAVKKGRKPKQQSNG